ncbi:MAG: hypothetical protein ABH864_02815 [archaeon]
MTNIVNLGEVARNALQIAIGISALILTTEKLVAVKENSTQIF